MIVNPSNMPGVESKQSFISKHKNWLPVIIIMLIAALLRLRANNTGNYLLVGGDGPYYPIQVRSLLEHYRLAFPDMPLFFIIEALSAKFLTLFHFSREAAILLSVKYVDAFLPPLAAIPVYLITKEYKTDGIKNNILNYILVAFAVINMTTTLFFPSGLQKNATAVVLIFYFIYFLIRLVKHRRYMDIIYMLITTLLCALTHFGSFTLILIIAVFIAAVWLLYNRHILKSITLAQWLIPVSTVICFGIIIALFDVDRFNRLLHFPLKVFQYPVFLIMLSGQDITHYFTPLHFIIGNLLAIIAALILLVNSKSFIKADKILVVSLVLATLFFSSLLLGLEWASRFYVMAYIPIVVAYIILLNALKPLWIKLVPLTIFSILILMCLLTPPNNKGCITNQAYTELKQISPHINMDENCVIIGRQDLRLLCSWEYKTKAFADYYFTKADFNKYSSVYVIRQIKGSNMGTVRPRGDADVPTNGIKVYENTCFELYKINNSNGWQGGYGKPSVARGIIISSNENNIILKNEKSGRLRSIDLSKNTHYNLIDKSNKLTTGMPVDVYGHYEAFSLNVAAELISERIVTN